VTVNKERVQLLVDALRSGEFQQRHGDLRGNAHGGGVSYCCLGVATEVALRNGAMCLEAWGGTALHWRLAQWYGFESGNPIIRPAPCRDAVAANDICKLDFNQIADAFEETFLRETNPT
jgi:hypothetical protein